MEELKPCQRCKSTNVTILKNLSKKPIGVVCNNCHIEICFFDEQCHNVACRTETDGEPEIITAWNHRPSPWILITPETMLKEIDKAYLTFNSFTCPEVMTYKGDGEWSNGIDRYINVTHYQEIQLPEEG